MDHERETKTGRSKRSDPSLTDADTSQASADCLVHKRHSLGADEPCLYSEI